MPAIPECDSCDFRLWPARCHAAKIGVRRLCTLAHEMGREDYRQLIANLTLGQSAPIAEQAPTYTVEQAMAISTCKARVSTCECVGKEAVCKPHGRHPGPVRCLTAGPGGTPCGGV